MWIALIIILWIADIVFQFFRYKNTSFSEKSNYLGMICAMVASGIITYLIFLADRPGNTVSIVNGVRVSRDAQYYFERFSVWLVVGAALNLPAMGIGYFLSNIKKRKR